MNNKLGQNMMTADKVRELLNKANIPTTPTYMGPSLPQAPKGNKLGKAASSIGKGIIGTLPILTQTAVQSGKDLIQQQGDTDFRTARMNQAIAQTNPALTEARFNQSRYGTPLPINQNLQSATQSLKDAQINTPIDLNSMGGKLMQGSIQDWEYATKDLSGGQRFLADTGRSILENAVTLPLALVNPSLPLAAMGARATASKAYDLSQQGVGASEALSRGLVSGGIEALTEKIPLENVLKLGKEGSKQIIKSLLKQSGIEATEESASYALNYLADKAYKDPNATFSIKELAMSAAGGALSGGVMGGGAMAFNKVANRQPSLPQAPQSQPSQPIPNLLQLPPPRWYVNPDGNIANDPSKTFQTATPTQVSVKTEPTMKMLPAPRMYVDPDGEASYNLTKPEQQVNANPDLHIDKRTNLDAKDNKVNAFQYDNPQIKPFYQEQANYLLSDLQNGVKGKRFVSEDGTWTGQKRLNSEPIEKLLNSGLNYEQIEKGLMRIIQDAGKENTVTAKRIEFAIDEALSKGYLSLNGDIPANDAYVIAKSEIPGASGNHIFTDDEINLIQQQQRNPDYKVRHGRQVIDGYVKPEPITPYEPPTPDYKVRYGRQAIQTPDQQATAIQTNTPSEPVLPRNPQKVNKPSLAKNKAVVEPTVQLPEPSNKVELGSNKNKPTFKDALNKFYTSVVDTQAPISRFSEKAKDSTATLASNSRNVGGTVNYIITDALVDRNGNKIGKSLKEVSELIPKGQEQSFWDYFSHLHNIDRAREGKNVIANYTAEMSQEYVNSTDKQNPSYRKIAREISDWINTMTTEWGVNVGTIDREVYGQLRETYKNYFPTQREFSQLEKSVPGSVRRQFVDTHSPLKKASGSSRDINNPIENIMSLVDRTVKTARYNEVGQSLLESIRQNPEALSEYAQEIEMDEGKVSKANNVVTILENGKPVYLQINDKDLLLAMNGLPKIINNAKAMRAVTRVFKGLITQWNPFFAVRNVARDIPTAYVYGSESNPAKFIGGLFKSVRDIVTNTPEYQRYKAVGGGSSNFFSPSQAEQAAKKLQQKPSLPKRLGGAISHGIETLNNATETAPRLAEFNRVFNKTGDIQKALAAANDVTVNFARGGSATKSAEPFVPYLNAGVQGVDKFFKGFKNPKVAIRTIIRSGIAVTLPEIALHLINKDDEEYEKLDNRTKDTYFLIPKGDGTFIKIPKSRELGVLFGSLFQRIFRQVNGEDEAFKGFAKTALTNFAPANPIENNFFSPIYNLKSNKDFADRTIVPMGMQMDKRSPYLQYDERTTEIAKAIGKYSAKFVDGGLSPKQIDYIIKSYTGVIATVVQPLTTQGQSLPDMLSRQFVSDPLYSNEILNDFYEKLDELTQNATDKNITGNIPGGATTPEEKVKNSMNKISKEISALQKEKNKAQAQGNIEKVDSIQRQILQKAKSGLTQIERESRNLSRITQYLNTNQKATFSKNKDDASLKYVSAVTTNKAYNRITDNQKDKASIYAYDYSVALAETNVSLKKLDGWYKDASELEKQGIPIDTLLISKAITSGVVGEKGKDDKTIPLSAARNKKAAVDRLYGNYSLNERKSIYEFCGIAKSVWYE